LPNACAKADVGVLFDVDIRAQSGAWRNVAVSVDAAVMFHDGAAVHDGVGSYSGASVNNASG
jgi:hypothetical protein